MPKVTFNRELKMYDRNKLVLNTVRMLLDGDELKLSRISAQSGVSRDTASVVLEELLDLGMLERGSGYRLSKSFCPLVLRVSDNEAYITVYDVGKGICERHTAPFSYALSRGDNIMLACSALNNYRLSLAGNGVDAICCFVYDDTSGGARILPDIFLASARVEDIVALELLRDGEGSCMFISDVAFMCAEGKSVSATQRTPSDKSLYVSRLLECIRPLRIVVEGEGSDGVISVCREKNVRCEAWESDGSLTRLEKYIIAQAAANFAAELREKKEKTGR